MTRTRALLAVTAAVATGLVLLLGGVFSGSASPGSASSGAPAGAAGARALGGFSAGADGTAAEVARLEAAVQAHPTDVKSLALLGLAYGQRWRETGDATFVSLEARSLREASALSPHDPLTVQGLGSLALTQHQFRKALQIGRLAERLAPYAANTYGIVGDAQIELGHY